VCVGVPTVSVCAQKHGWNVLNLMAQSRAVIHVFVSVSGVKL
jgi:hypothetical protein